MKNIFAFILSLSLHLIFFVFLFYTKSDDEKIGGLDAKIGEYQSIKIVANLPISSLKEYSINQTKSLQNDDDTQKEIIKTEKSDFYIKQKTNLKPTKKKQNKKNTPQSSLDSNINQIAKQTSASIVTSGDKKEISTPVLGINANTVKSYKSLVMAYLNKFKKYPYMALKRNIEEKISAVVTIDKDGNILDIDIKNAKNEILKNACKKLFADAKILPKPPIELLNQNILKFNIVIDYNIKKYNE